MLIVGLGWLVVLVWVVALFVLGLLLHDAVPVIGITRVVCLGCLVLFGGFGFDYGLGLFVVWGCCYLVGGVLGCSLGITWLMYGVWLVVLLVVWLCLGLFSGGFSCVCLFLLLMLVCLRLVGLVV